MITRTFDRLVRLLQPPTTGIYQSSIRTLYKKRFFRGIYITDGMHAQKGDVLLRQWRLQYHPGLNVAYTREHGDRVLRAMCPGTVFITTEESHPNYENSEMKELYEWRKDVPLRKLTFNVVPDEQIGLFRLRETI